MNTQVWAKSRAHIFTCPLPLPHVCKRGGEDLHEGIKNPIEVDLSVVNNVPLWWGNADNRGAFACVRVGGNLCTFHSILL